MMEYLLLFAAGTTVALVIRTTAIYLHWDYYSKGFLGDAAVHIAITRQLRKEWNPKYIPEFLIGDMPMAYPRGFHRFGRLFPASVLDRLPCLPNLVLFTLSSGLFTAYMGYVANNLLHVDSKLFVASACLFFFLSVTHLIFYYETYHYLGFSERLTGRITTASFILLTHFGTTYGDSFSLYIAPLAAAYGILSSKFSRQALVLIVPPASLLYFNWSPLLALLAGLALATLCSPRYLWWSIRIHILHLVNYWEISHNDEQVKAMLAARSLLDFKELYACFRKVIKREQPISTLYSFAFLEPFRTALFLPEIWLLLIIKPHAVANPFILMTGAVYLLVASKFRFIGEAFRYPEFVLYFLFPTLLAQSVLASGMGAPVLAYFSLILLFSGATYYKLSRHSMRDHRESNEALNEIVESGAFKGNEIVYPITLRVGADLFARVPCKTFWWQPGTITRHLFKEYCEENFYPKKDWDSLFERYEVTHVLCEKHLLAQLNWEYDFSGVTLVTENNRYALYKVPQNSRTTKSLDG